MIRRMPKEMRVASLQGQTAQDLIPKAAGPLDTLVYLRQDQLYTRSEAVIRAVSDLGRVWKPVSLLLFIPAIIRDAVYRTVAKNRYSLFGKRKTCRIPAPNEREFFLD